MARPVTGHKDKNFMKFVSDCQRRGLTVAYSEGVSDPRPFVRCVNPFDVKEATDVKIQWIRKQSLFIVFPVKAKTRATPFDVTL